MENNITIALLLGTSRENRESIKPARFIEEYARQLPGVEVVFVDPKDFTFNGDGNKSEGKDARYTEITARADAFFIVTPEYNHSFPGSLKRMIDSEYENYRRKPVMLAGVSDGSWGGVRACEALIPVCHKVGLINIQSELYFPRVQDIFDENGAMQETFRGRYEESLRKIFEELLLFARVCKQLR